MTRRLGWLLVLAVAGICGGDDALAMAPERVSTTASTLPLPATFTAASATSASTAVPAACSAPSSALATRDDALTLSVLSSCPADDPFVARVSREQPLASRCGTTGARADVARILASALPLDEATAVHVRRVFVAGRTKGLHADVFGLVGDSITVQTNFMTPFARSSGLRVALSPEVRDALSIEPTATGEPRTVLDWFRGSTDSFHAPRAAKVGERANWAIQPRGRSTPLGDMVNLLSPAFAVVLYGTNDAAMRAEDPDAIAERFESALDAIVDTLEDDGIVPILTTVPKHMHDSRFPDCAAGSPWLSNERLMVQTNAVNAVVARTACERALPLVDFRWAIDDLLNHGVGGDGVHPTVYPMGGGGVLDANGLACGLNARNLATLRMLKQLHDVVGAMD